MTLYLKYRPQKISELDITPVRDTLLNIFSSKNIPHAFLFAGPKGTGKTSAARIVAKAINCESGSSELRGPTKIEPCNECDTCLSITAGTNIDVIEMDAASNRGIDDVRALKQELMLSPVASRRKIYIIDEAHMLTSEAANALLKTLEEPPAHVLFILATTDPQKLPATIHSRLTTVPFRKATQPEIVQKLTSILLSEKAEAEEGVKELIASASDGAFRDAVKLLEGLLTGGKITLEAARLALYGASQAQPVVLLRALAERDMTKALLELEQIGDRGVSLKQYTAEIITRLHQALLAHYSIGKAETYNLSVSEITELIDLLLNAQARLATSSDALSPLLIVVAQFCNGVAVSKQSGAEKNSQGSSVSPEKINLQEKDTSAQKKTEKVVKEELKVEKSEVIEVEIKSQSDTKLDAIVWTKLLSEVKVRNAPVEALLRAAHPMNFDGKNLEVGVYYRFHKERLEVNLHRDAFEEAAKVVFGVPIRVIYELTERPQTQTLPSEPSINLTAPKAPDIIEAAKEIFGN